MTRIIKLDHPKLTKLIQEKEKLIMEGRKIAAEIDLVKEAMATTEKKLIAEESLVNIQDLIDESMEVKKKVLNLLKLGEAIQQRIYKRVRENTPQETRDQYDTLKKQKEEKETLLNKLGHKVQKVKDKIIPIVQKLGKPYLEDEFDDFATTKLGEDGVPELEIFNYVEEFKANKRKK